MYDTVTKQFFTNVGTGTFVAGAVTGVGEGTTTLKISANVPTKTSQLTNDSDSIYINRCT